MTYRLSAAGRWKLIALLAAALLGWLLALVLLRQIWGPPPAEGQPPSPLQGQVVPGYLFLAVVLAGPLLAWDLMTELFARYEVDESGLRFRTLALDATYPWESITALKPVSERGDEERRLDVIAATGPLGGWRRILHPQSYGRGRVPIYPDVADRETLVATIRRQVDHFATREQEGSPTTVV